MRSADPLSAFFKDAVLPVLTPLAIDVSRPFPLLSSLSLNLAVLLDAAPGETDHRLAIVQVPTGLTRLVQISDADGASFVLLEDVVRAHLPQLFPGQPILEASVIRLARDAELEFDDEGGRTQLELVERELRERRRSDVVRLEVEATASDELVALILRQLDVGGGRRLCRPGSPRSASADGRGGAARLRRAPGSAAASRWTSSQESSRTSSRSSTSATCCCTIPTTPTTR